MDSMVFRVLKVFEVRLPLEYYGIGSPYECKVIFR